jgi:cell wall-associated NlpC family hydrolase
MVGKPYHYGGNNPNTGFDCSGLVQWSYGRAGVRLPHGTDYLRRQSRPISLSSVRRGDLIFFTQLGKGSSHVAIYIGDDRFVHSPSTGKNVYVATLTDSYWKKHFDQARRLERD